MKLKELITHRDHAVRYPYLKMHIIAVYVQICLVFAGPDTNILLFMQ